MYRDWWRPGQTTWRRFPETGVPPPRGEGYVTVQRFPLPEHVEQEPHLAPLYFDFDGQQGGLDQVAREALTLAGYLDEMLDVPPEGMRLFFTGGRGIHVEVLEQVLGVTEPTADLTYAYGLWAGDLAERLHLASLDRRVYSARRMWRQEGSRHPHTGLYKVEIAPGELGRGAAYLQTLARTPRPALPYNLPTTTVAAAETLQQYLHRLRTREQGRQAPVLAAGIVPPCVESLLVTFWPERGQSNRALLFLSTYFLATGTPEEEAIAAAVEWYKTVPDSAFNSVPRNRFTEAAKVVRCVYRSPARYPFGCRFAKALGVCPVMNGRCELVQRKSVAKLERTA